MRIAAVILVLLCTPSFAKDEMLAPGKPAGVHDAQQNITLAQAGLVALGVGGAIAGIGMALGTATGTGGIFSISAAVTTSP